MNINNLGAQPVSAKTIPAFPSPLGITIDSTQPIVTIDISLFYKDFYY